ncbi:MULTISPECIES: hypothetical protein [unclassified Agarivorans]|uniref:hypothetical protein n=1 Tax=unclassified Agarivorans TaxID=2636026 RepID=UPI0010D8342C|nr:MULTISPECIES: hypothetical protein [unclassified Agarivorans]MDO6763912.1 hypothetical protein [Agarivorans sp. 1_MG-2023]GDY27807.1 hypothetical protein AHAT_36970 [Agarivorans sp. Toyoura001]
MNIDRLIEHLSLSSEQISQFTELEQQYSQLMDNMFGFEGDRKQMWKAMRDLVKEKDLEIIKLLDKSQLETYLTLKQIQKQQRRQS